MTCSCNDVAIAVVIREDRKSVVEGFGLTLTLFSVNVFSDVDRLSFTQHFPQLISSVIYITARLRIS